MIKVKIKIKLSIKNASSAVNFGSTLIKAYKIVQWLYENIPW